MSKFRKKRDILTLDLTPLIDVVFLLIIFFMVTTTFDKYGKLDIDLPTANMQSEDDDKKLVELVIDKNEKYFVIKDFKTTQITLDELGSYLNDTKDVTISADKNLKYQLILDAISKVKSHNITNIGINFDE